MAHAPDGSRGLSPRCLRAGPRQQEAPANRQVRPGLPNESLPEGYDMNRWDRTLDLSDVFHADMPFAEKRDEMVRRVRALDPREDDGELQCIADELADTQDGDEWDGPWGVFYDWADFNRVWVNTFARREQVAR